MKKQILAASLLGALALPAAAEGIYVLGDLGQTRFSGNGFEEYNPTASLGVGYKINQGFSLEAAYRIFDNLDYRSRGIYYGYNMDLETSVDLSALQLSLVGTIPFTDNFSAYARLGYALLKYDQDVSGSTVFNGSPITASNSDSDTAYRAAYGIGARYAITDRIGLRFEYGDICEWEGVLISSTTLGADYRF